MTPRNTLLFHVVYYIKFRRSRSSNLGVVESQNLGEGGASLSWDGAWFTPQGHATAPLCYRTEFRRSASNRSGAGMGSPKKFFGRSLGPAPWMIHRNTVLPNMCYSTKFGGCRSNRLDVGSRSQSWGLWGPAPWDWT